MVHPNANINTRVGCFLDELWGGRTNSGDPISCNVTLCCIARGARKESRARHHSRQHDPNGQRSQQTTGLFHSPHEIYGASSDCGSDCGYPRHREETPEVTGIITYRGVVGASLLTQAAFETCDELGSTASVWLLYDLTSEVLQRGVYQQPFIIHLPLSMEEVPMSYVGARDRASCWLFVVSWLPTSMTKTSIKMWTETWTKTSTKTQTDQQQSMHRRWDRAEQRDRDTGKTADDRIHPGADWAANKG
ncbi:hypothetical protein F5Y12DRAFT_718768 [Xylaria sp. FL1777]|nr:hypothetical protein F5Y12DRAFT_718768 [Xylaria sp. FL1777]